MLADRPAPSAKGLLKDRPLAHLLMFAIERKLTGTLSFMDGAEEKAHLYLVEGLPTRLLRIGAPPRLLDSELPRLFDLPASTVFVFYKDFDGAGDLPGEPTDPHPFFLEGLVRNPPRAQMDVALSKLRNVTLRIAGDLNQFRFDTDVKAALDALEGPLLPVANFLESTRLEQAKAQALLYLLVITKCALVEGASPRPATVAPAVPTAAVPTAAVPTAAVPTAAAPTAAVPTAAAPTAAVPTAAVPAVTATSAALSPPPASVPPASVSPASVPPASVPPASVPPASVPPASVPPASVPPAAAALGSGVPDAAVSPEVVEHEADSDEPEIDQSDAIDALLDEGEAEALQAELDEMEAAAAEEAALGEDLVDESVPAVERYPTPPPPARPPTPHSLSPAPPAPAAAHPPTPLSASSEGRPAPPAPALPPSAPRITAGILANPAVKPSTPAVAQRPIAAAAFARMRLQTQAKVKPLEEQAVVSPNDRRRSNPAQAAAKEEDITRETRRQEILARAKDVEKIDFFELLGVTRETPPEQINSAFFALAKRWHPDRLPAALADVKLECSKVFSKMSEAHQTLSDPDRRATYLRSLTEGAALSKEQEKVAQILEASSNFQKADVLFKRGDVVQAEILARQALTADPDQADYLALVAQIAALKPENQTPEKLIPFVKDLTVAIKKNEKCERAYIARGSIFKKLGQAEAAVRDFKVVVELNPRNVDAQREVRLYNMRGETGGKVKTKTPAAPVGVFGKLFKK